MLNIKSYFAFVHFKDRTINFDFSEKIIKCTSFAPIFPMEKLYSKLFFGIKCIFVNQFSKFLRHNLRFQKCKWVT